MQLFAKIGYESKETKGFGWIDGIVKKINNINKTLKLPHMGWNQIEFKKDFSLFSGIENQSHMYFVHSYEFLTKQKDCVVATTNYGNSIIAAVTKDNIFGTQFHPHKAHNSILVTIPFGVNVKASFGQCFIHSLLPIHLSAENIFCC